MKKTITWTIRKENNIYWLQDEEGIQIIGKDTIEEIEKEIGREITSNKVQLTKKEVDRIKSDSIFW